MIVFEIAIVLAFVAWASAILWPKNYAPMTEERWNRLNPDQPYPLNK